MSSPKHGETLVVRGEAAPEGERGEKLLVNGARMGMRLWEREAAGTKKPEHANPYEYVAYVLEGALRVTVNGHTFEVHKGDSYCVPEQANYSLEITEEATVVEATCPSSRGPNTFKE